MVYWHTAWKKHHSWMIRKFRLPTYIALGLAFYYAFWFNRSSGRRTLEFLDHTYGNDAKAQRNKRDFGYRHHYEPLIARSRKNLLLAQGNYQMRLPFEDQLRAHDN